jgi:hypothetical protein
MLGVGCNFSKKLHMENQQPKRNLLYYPYIDIPRKDWLYSSILYSDTISTIVPFQSVDDADFPKELKPLYDKGIYKPVFIEQLLNDYKEEFWEFEKIFIETTTGAAFKKLKKGTAIEQPTMLYHQKLTYNIYQHLRNENLIKGEGAKGIVVTEQNSALLYMALLAQYVAKTSQNDLIIPSTDLKQYERIAFELTKDKIPAFTFLLEKSLPVPDLNVPLEKILQFKKDRKDELYQFRKFLNAAQDKIKKASDRQEVTEILIDTRESIEKGIRDIEKTLKDGRIKTFFTSFDTLLKLENPKLFGTLTAAGLVTIPINPIAGIITGLIGVVGGLVSSYLSTNREVGKADLSYLFKARQENIIKSSSD